MAFKYLRKGKQSPILHKFSKKKKKRTSEITFCMAFKSLVARLPGINFVPVLNIRLWRSKGFFGALDGNLSVSMTTVPGQSSSFIP